MEKICKECGEKFKTNRGIQLFCKKTCSNLYANRSRLAEERKQKKEYEDYVQSISLFIERLSEKYDITVDDLSREFGKCRAAIHRAAKA